MNIISTEAISDELWDRISDVIVEFSTEYFIEELGYSDRGANKIAEEIFQKIDSSGNLNLVCDSVAEQMKRIDVYEE